ncbi:stealth family protein [Streptomyces sp. NPDC088923]|uniref:stealth family protein n=1 Tax=Streptomyces sp. NPDC088923 TaxID=3365913 RepID=UPI0037FC32EB
MSGNAEAGAAVTVYRSLVPPSVRGQVARHVPPRVRQGVKGILRQSQLLAPLTGAVREARARRRWPGMREGERSRTVAVRGSHIAMVREDATPVLLREENLDLIAGLLEREGIDHFAVRGKSELRSVLAVPEHAREQVAAALTELAVTLPLYVGACDGESLRGRPVLCGSGHAERLLRQASVLRVGVMWSDPGGSHVLGLTHSCDLEFWRAEDGMLHAPRPNRVTDAVAVNEALVLAPARRLTQFAPAHSTEGRRVPTLPIALGALPEDIRFPIDAVYTWVDGEDPAWQARRADFGEGGYHAEAANAARYISRDELRFSLRSLHQNAPWIRRVFLVTDQQRPTWLDDFQPWLTVVDHREIFTDPGLLPTFNSHAIESQLHHIEGLAEHFLYFNDDMFLGRPVLPQTFFLSNGMTRIFLSPAQVPSHSWGEADRPVDAAGKNNRRLIRERFGSTIVQKLRHAPYALRRSVLYELEETFADEHANTAASRFRSPADISIPSSLYHYYAYHTGRAVPSDIEFAYLDLARTEIARRLGILLARRDRQAFCINDTLTEDFGEGDRRTQQVRTFLQSYFPVPSPFERKETGPR